jgi:hypothetical protein
MTKYQMYLGMFIASIFLSPGFKNDLELKKIYSENSDDPVKVSIAETTAYKGDKGQRPVRVMIYLSKATTEPVTVSYSTVDGSAKAGVDYIASKGSVTFEPGQTAKWITVPIIGEVAADPDEDAPAVSFSKFIVRLTQATTAILAMSEAYITILEHIAANPSLIGAHADEAIYQVIISYTGYTSFAGKPGDCGIRKDGVVVLSGYLSGSENLGPDDDTRYTGNLEMIIDIDICSIHRLPGSDEDRFCGIRVNGTGKVYTELKIVFGSDMSGNYDGRGGYINIENKDGRFIRTVTGECGEQVDEEWTMVPNKSISSVFNGCELSMLTDRTFRKKTYTHTDDDGNITVVEVLRKIK